MSREALPPDATVRLDHAGEWAAWDRDMWRAAAIAAGAGRLVCEWVPPVPVRPDDYAG